MERPKLRIAGTVSSTRDPDALASFYQRLLGWDRVQDEPDWVVIRDPASGQNLAFHVDVEYQPPLWPSTPNAPIMMMHLDIATDDFKRSVLFALQTGASESDHQPDPDVRVMLDPEGHPFCLFASPNW